MVNKSTQTSNISDEPEILTASLVSEKDPAMTLVFAGDSITDADHLWEPGEDGLGNGFVQIINQLLKAEQDKDVKFPSFRIINSGYNGFRAEDLRRRFDYAVLDKNPDFVTLLIGVNEAGAAAEGMVTSPEAFLETYESMIVDVLTKSKAKMILMEPFLFRKPAYLINWRPYFESLLPVIRELADKYGLNLIRLDSPLNDMADRYGPDRITIDGIHLTKVGEQYLAERWMETFRKIF